MPSLTDFCNGQHTVKVTDRRMRRKGRGHNLARGGESMDKSFHMLNRLNAI